MSVRRAGGRWLVALLAVSLAATPAEAQARRRHLESRAVFAALDSVALADSFSMRRADPSHAPDSLLLNMVAYLDAAAGPAFGLTHPRLRGWDGYGSQAHPVLGILIDGQELAQLVGKVTALKAMAGVPKAEAERRVQYVLRFLVAHEYAHLMQYQAYGEAAVNDPDSTRVIECGADLIGGLSYREFLGVRYGSRPPPDEAIATARDFGYVVGAPDWLDGTTHPLPEDRRLCIVTGMGTAGALNGAFAYRHGARDSASVRAADYLRREEPELDQAIDHGTVNLMAWSRVKARKLAAAGAVVDGSQVLAVVRDSSVTRLVGKLAAAAVQGSAALRRFRGGHAPDDSTAYLLREALPPPWECTISERLGGEEAYCGQNIRSDAAGRSLMFDRLVYQVKRGLGEGWHQVQPDTTASGYTRPWGKDDQRVVFVSGGGAAYDLVTPQIELALSGGEMFSPAQLPARYLLSITVRSAAARSR